MTGVQTCALPIYSDGALINPAGFMIGYPALAAAISQVPFPTIEVHISNPARRGISSEIAKVCRATVTGCGIFGYDLALRGILRLIEPAKSGT